MIEFSGLYKSFNNVSVLKNINLFIQEGEIFGIIGQSGAGKSTLLRTINLLERPAQGEIIVDNQVITDLHGQALRQLRYKIGMIFQHFNLLDSQSVYDNIALPLRIQGWKKDTIKFKVEELLELVNLKDKKNAFPLQLSGGQKQRVAIARALSSSPKILLCDEATSALDPQSTQAILDLLRKINIEYGITIVVVTHEMEVIKNICHRLAVMEEGELLEVDSLSGILANPYSIARNMLFSNLQPKLPICLTKNLKMQITDRILLRLDFQGQSATVPFISQSSRALNLDINILLANIDRVEDITCGVLVVEIHAAHDLQKEFVRLCRENGLTVEILGYVASSL